MTGFKFSLDGLQTNSSGTNSVDKNATVLKTVFSPADDAQDISPNTFNVQVGKSYVLEVDAKEDGQGCMSTIMIPGVYDDPILITKGIVRLPFKIDEPGSYDITCAMGIIRGTITAADEKASDGND